jgi:hypothetical protein
VWLSGDATCLPEKCAYSSAQLLIAPSNSVLPNQLATIQIWNAFLGTSHLHCGVAVGMQSTISCLDDNKGNRSS